MRAIPVERTLRLLIDWPINGMRMMHWIVEKDPRTAAALVATGWAEYVPRGTPPPPDQLEWGLALQRASASRTGQDRYGN